MREWLVRKRTHHKTGKQRNLHIFFLLRMICVLIELLSSPEVHRVIIGINQCMDYDCPKRQNTFKIIRMIQSYEHNMNLDIQLFC